MDSRTSPSLRVLIGKAFTKRFQKAGIPGSGPSWMFYPRWGAGTGWSRSQELEVKRPKSRAKPPGCAILFLDRLRCAHRCPGQTGREQLGSEMILYLLFAQELVSVSRRGELFRAGPCNHICRTERRAHLADVAPVVILRSPQPFFLLVFWSLYILPSCPFRRARSNPNWP